MTFLRSPLIRLFGQLKRKERHHPLASLVTGRPKWNLSQPGKTRPFMSLFISQKKITFTVITYRKLPIDNGKVIHKLEVLSRHL